MSCGLGGARLRSCSLRPSFRVGRPGAQDSESRLELARRGDCNIPVSLPGRLARCKRRFYSKTRKKRKMTKRQKKKKKRKTLPKKFYLLVSASLFVHLLVLFA